MRTVPFALALIFPLSVAASELVYPPTAAAPGPGIGSGSVVVQRADDTMTLIRPTFGGGWVIDTNRGADAVITPTLGGGWVLRRADDDTLVAIPGPGGVTQRGPGGDVALVRPLDTRDGVPVALDTDGTLLLLDSPLDTSPLPLAGLR